MSEVNDQYKERLVTLRDVIKKHGLDGYILPRTDEFQGEFLAEYAERLAWLTGFTGSAGSAVILEDRAAVFSDGRYTIQLKDQINNDIYQAVNIVEKPASVWLVENAGSGSRIGYDVWLFTPRQLEKMKTDLAESDIVLVPVDANLIDEIWDDQPEKPMGQVSVFPSDIAGKTSLEKRQELGGMLHEAGLKACLLTMGDSICWILNVRGDDISFSPLMLSYAVLHADGALDWFIESGKLSSDVVGSLGSNVHIYGMRDVSERMEDLSGNIGVDFGSAPVWFVEKLMQAGCEVVDFEDPCVLPKACKTVEEQKALKLAHLQDGVAVVRFLKWVDENANKIKMTELSVEDKLESFRRQSDAYLGPSFSTIAGFAENGAIVHYRATEQSSKTIEGDGLLLVDSGGQYQWGTTDITRTISIGTPTQEMRQNYTRVLKGHIAVASAVFPVGTVGRDIDQLARQPLLDVGLDYAHGTGHGVGCYLCVHEAAANMSIRGEKPFSAGMLLSNEPGYYKEGAYGIRIENLVLVINAEQEDMLSFDTVSFAPFDKDLIDVSMLSDSELSWLRSYSKKTLETLSPHLSEAETEWLQDAVRYE